MVSATDHYRSDYLLTFLTGDITKYEQQSVMAVIVPNREVISRWAAEHQPPLEGDYVTLLAAPQVKAIV